MLAKVAPAEGARFEAASVRRRGPDVVVCGRGRGNGSLGTGVDGGSHALLLLLVRRLTRSAGGHGCGVGATFRSTWVFSAPQLTLDAWSAAAAVGSLGTRVVAGITAGEAVRGSGAREMLWTTSAGTLGFAPTAALVAVLPCGAAARITAVTGAARPSGDGRGS